MSDIFKNKNIYPHKGKIKDHFKDFYDAAFVAFLPVFQVDRNPSDLTKLKKSKQISYEEAKEEIDFLKDIPPFNADIFSYSNKDYPTDEEIYKRGEIITWDKVVKGAGLADNSELNKALKTSIGALRLIFQRTELTDKLNKFTDSKKIWHPSEGSFDTFSKKAIYKAFKLFDKKEIIITDEFYTTSFTIELHDLTEIEFSEKVRYHDYYIYSSDKELLFTIEWDSFFFLIATGQEKMNKIISSNLFEGFVCNDKTEHTWDYEEEEFQKILDKEKKLEVLTCKPKTKKQWWKFWN